MRAIDKLREITGVLKSSGIESAEKEAEIMLRQCLNITTGEIYRDNPGLNNDQIRTVKCVLDRRLRREPFQYIVGFEEFMGLRLMVGPGVLIPRPETEFLAEQAIKTVKREALSVKRNSKNTKSRTPQSQLNSSRITHHTSRSILDLCTGSGCLALALAKEFPDLKVFGTDISEFAIEYAKENAGLNCINNVTFLTGNLFEPVERLFTPLERKPEQGFLMGFTADLIISNPPYIKSGDIGGLQPEIKDWEPVVALDGGVDGLDFYRELIPLARRFLKDEGVIMLELGDGQAGRVADIMDSLGYTQIEIIRDYAGIERIINAKWKR